MLTLCIAPVTSPGMLKVWFTKGCKQTSEPPVFSSVCKMGWEVGVCSRLIERSHGALIAISVLQDVLPAHCSAGVPRATADHAVLA